MICPTTKGKFCPTGYFVAATAANRNGHDWTKRYPWTVESALNKRIDPFVIDGEAVIPGVAGVSDFDCAAVRQAQ